MTTRTRMGRVSIFIHCVKHVVHAHKNKILRQIGGKDTLAVAYDLPIH